MELELKDKRTDIACPAQYSIYILLLSYFISSGALESHADLILSFSML